jgi:hypothetical protein
VARVGSPFLSKSFHTLKDAEAWSRQMEVQADRGDLPSDPKALEKLTLGDLVRRYRDTVSPGRRLLRQNGLSSMPSFATQYAANDSRSFVQSTLPPIGTKDSRTSNLLP